MRARFGRNRSGGGGRIGVVAGLLLLVGLASPLWGDDEVAARRERAQALVAAARHDEAVEVYRGLLALAPDAAVQQELARALVLAGRPGEAATEYRALVARSPGARALRRSLVRALSADGQRAEAIPLLDALIAEDPRDTEALRERALIARALGDFATARRLFRQALAAERDGGPVPESPFAAGAATAPAAPPGGPAPTGPDPTLPLLLGVLGLGIAAGRSRTLGPRSYGLLLSGTALGVAAVLAWLRCAR